MKQYVFLLAVIVFAGALTIATASADSKPLDQLWKYEQRGESTRENNHGK